MNQPQARPKDSYNEVFSKSCRIIQENMQQAMAIQTIMDSLEKRHGNVQTLINRQSDISDIMVMMKLMMNVQRQTAVLVGNSLAMLWHIAEQHKSNIEVVSSLEGLKDETGKQ